MVRNLCAAMVRRSGFHALTAADGEEAVELFRNHAHEIMVVILDLTMPRMDGVATFDALRRISPDVKVILSSGYNETEATRRFAGHGLTAFIQKPYQLERLSEELARVRDGCSKESK
jgi:DNA-binding NtrC family response regulator